MLELKAPLLLTVEITQKCNLDCLYCFSRADKNGKEIPINILIDIVKEAAELKIFDLSISGGEPFMHKDIFELIEEALKLDLGISIVSNGTLITKDKARRLKDLGVIPNVQISFDGHTAHINNLTRGKFKSALRGLLNLVEIASSREETPSIGIVVNKYNYKHLPQIIDYFSSFVSRIHIMNVMNNPKLSLNSKERKELLSKILPKIKEIAIKNRLYLSLAEGLNTETDFELKNIHIDCLAGYTVLVIDSHLNIYPCDIARIRVGQWTGKGSILKAYQNSKKIWKKLTQPWCYRFGNFIYFQETLFDVTDS